MPDALAQPQQAGKQQPLLTGDAARNDLGLAMLRRLAHGQPLELDMLAGDTRRPVDEIRSERPWLAEHPDAVIVPVTDAQEQGRALIERLPAAGASCSDDCC